jgi:hypothetical protein
LGDRDPYDFFAVWVFIFLVRVPLIVAILPDSVQIVRWWVPSSARRKSIQTTEIISTKSSNAKYSAQRRELQIKMRSASDSNLMI